MFWSRNKNEYEIYINDLEDNAKMIQVKADVTPEEILVQMGLDGAYLVFDGVVLQKDNIGRFLRDGVTIYATQIRDRG
ncbi:unnamed protein product [Sphagnum balticum]